MGAADKIMFQIYREADYGRQFRIVYFTELDEHNKEREIGRALAGEPFVDGFIKELSKQSGKAKLDDFVKRLNRGESIDPADVERELAAVGALAE